MTIMVLTQICFTSCQDYSPGKESIITPVDNSINNLVADFYSECYPAETRTGITPRVLSIENKSYRFPLKKGSDTRSAEDSIFFDMQLVELDFGETKGFSLLSTDERLNRVFYFTDNGCISDTSFIAPLKDLIDVYPYVAARYIEDGTDNVTRTADEELILIPSFVRFKWHQGFPFNLCATYCICDRCKQKQNHMPIGCVAVALGQTIATIGDFKGHYYGSNELNFATLPSDGDKMTTAQQLNVGRFFADIALGCNMQFTCSGSGTYMQNAFYYLKEKGYDVEFSSGDIDTAKVIIDLSNGKPHLIAGDDGIYGHAWIIDGIRVRNSNYDYAINWGYQGLCDGWSDGTPYTSGNGLISYPNNNKHIYIH